MSNPGDKGNEWRTKAEKRIASKGWFESSATRFEEGHEWFTKAGTFFKLAKKWKDAGDAYVKAAECAMKTGSHHEAATAYTDAANAYKKDKAEDAVAALTSAAELWGDLGRFQSAARAHKDMAELLESEGANDRAIDAYAKAADFYSGEDATSQANACLLKVANMSAAADKFEKAISIYEQVAAASLDNNLLKWSVKDYIFRAVLCRLASEDPVGAKRSLEKYTDMDMTFSGTREHALLVKILSAVESYNVEAFTNAVYEFDNISKLDAWKTSILLKVKNTIKANDAGGLA